MKMQQQQHLLLKCIAAERIVSGPSTMTAQTRVCPPLRNQIRIRNGIGYRGLWSCLAWWEPNGEVSESADGSALRRHYFIDHDTVCSAVISFEFLYFLYYVFLHLRAATMIRYFVVLILGHVFHLWKWFSCYLYRVTENVIYLFTFLS